MITIVPSHTSRRPTPVSRARSNTPAQPIWREYAPGRPSRQTRGVPRKVLSVQHVSGNPVKYQDPSGHCAGDPSDLNNPDFGCWFLQGQIEDTYQLFLTGDWLLDELQTLLFAIGDMEAGLGGKKYFIAAFGGTDIHREQGVWTGPGKVPANFILKMTFWDAAFAKPLAATQWLILHEFGHAWDAFHALGTSLRLEREMGASSCLFELLTGCRYDIDESRPTVSEYAAENRRDDWAESWAAHMFRGSWPALVQSGTHNVRSDALSAGQERLQFVALEVQYFKETVSFYSSYPPFLGFGR